MPKNKGRIKTNAGEKPETFGDNRTPTYQNGLDYGPAPGAGLPLGGLKEFVKGRERAYQEAQSQVRSEEFPVLGRIEGRNIPESMLAIRGMRHAEAGRSLGAVMQPGWIDRMPESSARVLQGIAESERLNGSPLGKFVNELSTIPKLKPKKVEVDGKSVKLYFGSPQEE